MSYYDLKQSGLGGGGSTYFKIYCVYFSKHVMHCNLTFRVSEEYYYIFYLYLPNDVDSLHYPKLT